MKAQKLTNLLTIFTNIPTASGDDPQCSTPKRKSDAYNQSHLSTPGGTPTMHEDFELGSPTWPRTPASPVSVSIYYLTHTSNSDFGLFVYCVQSSIDLY